MGKLFANPGGRVPAPQQMTARNMRRLEKKEANKAPRTIRKERVELELICFDEGK